MKTFFFACFRDLFSYLMVDTIDIVAFRWCLYKVVIQHGWYRYQMFQWLFSGSSDKIVCCLFHCWSLPKFQILCYVLLTLTPYFNICYYIATLLFLLKAIWTSWRTKSDSSHTQLLLFSFIIHSKTKQKTLKVLEQIIPGC